MVTHSPPTRRYGTPQGPTRQLEKLKLRLRHQGLTYLRVAAAMKPPVTEQMVAMVLGGRRKSRRVMDAVMRLLADGGR